MFLNLDSISLIEMAGQTGKKLNRLILALKGLELQHEVFEFIMEDNQIACNICQVPDFSKAGHACQSLKTGLPPDRPDTRKPL